MLPRVRDGRLHVDLSAMLRWHEVNTHAFTAVDMFSAPIPERVKKRKGRVWTLLTQ
jgi:hypothetical protein